MAKLFVRERLNVGRGTGEPRFALVAVEGSDLKVYHSHLRKAEVEALAEAIGAELVYLPRGEKAGEGEGRHTGGGKRRGRHGGGEQ